jgi:hypothetical protein
MAPLQSSSGFPTAFELQSNLSICYLLFTEESGLVNSQRIQGMTMGVDKLKLQVLQ